MTRVAWGKPIEKQLDYLPEIIVRKFRLWVSLVVESGISEVRKHKGFHDEPLKGKRQGQRSVRLSGSYRMSTGSMKWEKVNGSRFWR